MGIAKNKPYIISVEDNPNDVILIKRIIEQRLPYLDVYFFPDAEETLQFLVQKNKHHHLPELMLLDIKLIKGNGLDLLQDLKTDARFQNIPVIILSSSDREDDKAIAKERGCNQYVEKPRSYQLLKEELPKIITFWTESKIHYDTDKN